MGISCRIFLVILRTGFQYQLEENSYGYVISICVARISSGISPVKEDQVVRHNLLCRLITVKQPYLHRDCEGVTIVYPESPSGSRK